MDFAVRLLGLPLFTLFVLIALGMWIGSLRVKGISLGSAGVLFVAMLTGLLRDSLPAAWLARSPGALRIPGSLTDLGLVLFVYGVGLHAGPRFFSMFRERGKAFVVVGFVSTGIAAVVTVTLAIALGLKPALAAGMFTGALTNMPGLAAVRDLISTLAPDQLGTASASYGIAYPFSIISAVVFVQLMPAMLRIRPEQAAAEAAEGNAGGRAPLERRHFRVTNPNCDGATIAQFGATGISEAALSRVQHDGQVLAARPDTVLHLGDVVRAVGTPEDMRRLATALGHEEEDVFAEGLGGIASEDVVVSRDQAIGRSIGALEPGARYGVVVTRVRREGIELAPASRLVLEPADVLRVVGHPDDVEAFCEAVGRQERRLEETSLIPFAAGIALGAAVGAIPVPLPGGLQLRLGMGGGAFIVALLLGHTGRIGPMRLYVPNAAKMLARDLGLVVFLAGAGIEAGEQAMSVLRQVGPQVVLAAAVVTLSAIASSVLLMHRVFRWNMLATAGALSAVMTNPPALAAANGLADSDAPAIAFATLYPVSTIAKILLAQGVFLTLNLLR